MAKRKRHTWQSLFAYADLDTIEAMYLEDDYDVDRIYEELFPSFLCEIENGEITGDDLYRCIAQYVKDMDWKKCSQ